MSQAPQHDASQNPYASSYISDTGLDAERLKAREFSLGKSALVWSTICSISAAPSFFLALGTVGVENVLWMVIGVSFFIVGYVAADGITFQWPFRRRVAVRLSLRITYTIRVAASVLFPVALFVDMFCGILSASFITALGFEPMRNPNMPGPIVLLWTLLQGVVLNAVLGVIWTILLGICWMVTNESAAGQGG
jgi:hypothetical protein